MKKFAIALAMAGVCMPAAAFAQDDYYNDVEEAPASIARDGLRVEARAVWESLSDPEEDIGIVYEFGKAVGFGGEVGYDFAIGDKTVVGPFVTFERSGVESCYADTDIDVCLSAKDFLAVGVHVGSATGPNGQIYGKLAYTQLALDFTGTEYDPIDNITYIYDDTETGAGFQFAFGYEHGFGDVMYGRVEMGVGENYDTYDFDFQRVTLGVAMGARF